MTVRIGTVRIGTARIGTVRIGTVRIRTGRIGTVSIGTVRIGTVSIGTVRIGTVRLEKRLISVPLALFRIFLGVSPFALFWTHFLRLYLVSLYFFPTFSIKPIAPRSQ